MARISILHAPTAAAASAATDQAGQRGPVLTKFGAGGVAVRYYAGATLVQTEVQGPCEPDALSPLGFNLGAVVRGSSVVIVDDALISHAILRAADGDDVLLIEAADLALANLRTRTGRVITLSDPVVGELRVTANSSLPASGTPDATAFTLALSATSGTNGVPVTVTVTPNGPVPSGGASVTLAASNGGVLGATSLSFTSGSTAAQTTTLTRSTAGTSAVTMTNNRGLTNTGSPASFTSAAVGVAVSNITLTSPTTATAPFAVAQAFKQGDIPAGSGVVVTGADAQATIKNTWPDGSAKIALVSGTAALTAATPATISFSAGTASAGTALTTTDLKNALTQQVTVDAGAFGAASWSNTDWDSPFQTWVSGHRMSSWVYRKPIGSDAHLVAWLEVRLFAGGEVEVLPWVENGYFNVASPTSKSATYSFFINAASRFSAAIDLPAHCRTPLVSGSLLSHWLGTDPGVVVKHDAAYLMATRLVPSYGSTVAADADRVAALPSTFEPLQLGNYDAAMGAGGYQPAIGLLPEWDVLYLTCPTSAAPWAGIQRNAYSAGRWEAHFRDETTNRPPRFSTYPTTVLHTNSGASTTGTYTPTPSGTAAPEWDIPHHPSVGYLAYLVTGRWYHMETVLFAATRNHFHQPDAARQTTSGIFRASSGASTLRGAAWAIRTLAQAATVVPDADATLRAEFVAALESNIDWNHTRYCAQPNNPFGIVESYGDNSTGADGRWVLPTWQHDYHTAAWGYAFALAPVSSGSKAKLHEFFHWTAQSVVGRLGGPSAGEWLYRDATPYLITVAASDAPDWATGAGPWPASWGAMYDLSYDGSTYAAASPGARTEGDLRGGNFPNATSYWGNLQAALSYAVEHGVSGASLARSRMMGASNWSSLEANFDTDPVWSVTPRAVALPAWRVGQAVNEWREISGTAGSLTVPSPVPSGNPLTRFTSWVSLGVLFGRIYSIANGGHADYAGNEVIKLDLLAQAPGAWALLRQPTPNASLVIDAEEYADGLPTSSHSYYDVFGIPALNRVMRFGIGSAWGNGNYTRPKVHAFNAHVNDYDAASTWPSIPEYTSRGEAKCINPNNGDVYVFGDVKMWRFRPSTRTWTALATHIQNGNAAYYRGMAFDTKRNRIVVFGDAYRAPTGCLIYDVSSNAWSQGDLTGTYAGAVAAQVGNCAHYDAASDRFLVKVNSGGADVVVVHPTTFATSLLTTTGTAPNTTQNGVFGLWLQVPELGGCAYVARSNSNVFFLRTE